MNNKLRAYKRILFAGIITIALGIVLTTTLGDRLGSVGIVVVAVGGLLFIIGMSQKAQTDKAEKQQKDDVV